MDKYFSWSMNQERKKYNKILIISILLYQINVIMLLH